MAVDDDLKRQLGSMGFLPGANVKVVRKAPFGGAILVEVGFSEYALGRDVAARIRVAPG